MAPKNPQPKPVRIEKGQTPVGRVVPPPRAGDNIRGQTPIPNVQPPPKKS